MSKRHDKLGIKQTIQIHWMDNSNLSSAYRFGLLCISPQLISPDLGAQQASLPH